MPTSRRKFMLQSSTALIGTGLAAALPLDAFAKSIRRMSANDKINFGLIGCNGMGWTDMKAQLTSVPESNCIALAYIDQSVLDTRAADVETLRGVRPKLFTDYRQLLDMKEVDAVIIATPDHWHCLILCDALSAGKHVYCEKPLANSIEEANVMLGAAKRAGKMVQIGQWQRSGAHYQ